MCRRSEWAQKPASSKGTEYSISQSHRVELRARLYQRIPTLCKGSELEKKGCSRREE